MECSSRQLERRCIEDIAFRVLAANQTPDHVTIARFRVRHQQALAAAGIAERPGVLLADSGYWSIANLTRIPGAPELLIPPARHARQGRPARTASPRHPTATGCVQR